MKRDQVAKCLSYIQSIEADPKAFEFRQPVDYIALELTDYPTIVTNPMDLSKIKVS